jgi:hypothetical protein
MPIDRDVQNRWILGNEIPGIKFSMNQRVRITAGAHAGTVGVLISIYEIESDPGFQLETDKGHDICVHQSELEVRKKGVRAYY